MRLQLIHNPDATANRLHVNPADLDQAENDIEHSVLVRAAPVVGGRASVMEFVQIKRFHEEGSMLREHSGEPPCQRQRRDCTGAPRIDGPASRVAPTGGAGLDGR